MTTEKRVTDLPTVSTAQLTDIVMAVQGFVDSSNIGISVQETWSQVLSLMQSNIILFYPGDPNGNVAGTTYQFCWDTTDLALYICTTSGTASTAVWTKIAGSNPVTFHWNASTVTPVTMVPNNGYLQTVGSLTTYVLPATSSFGDKLSIIGNAAGGWIITQGAGQGIRIGSASSTVGAGGSVASTNQYDAIELICVQANLVWQVNTAPQGNITIV
jgi:hypothetical protein